MNLNEALKLKVTSDDFAPIDIINVISSEQVVGKPSRMIVDITKRFFKNKFALIAFIIFMIILLVAYIVPLIIGPYPESINPDEGSISNIINKISYLPPRIPWLGIDGIYDVYPVSINEYNQLNNYMISNPDIKLFTGHEIDGTNVFLQNYNPYAFPALKDTTSLFGTDITGRDWAVSICYAARDSLTLAIICAFLSVLIGAIYGTIAGSFAGSWLDSIMMRFVEIISSVPLIVWILVFSLVVDPENSLTLTTIGIALVLTGWMWTAIIARTYVMRYKNAEFVQAAKTLGASQTRIVLTHLIPNISGRLAVSFVGKIPAIIFFEASLVFIGLRESSPNEVQSLGILIDGAIDSPITSQLLWPTLFVVIITLSSQIIANALNDALDPRVVG